MHLIHSVELTKTFGTQRAVDHVSLSVARGEVVGFLGPNGAGKSTTMRMITGFLDPDHGTSEICGHDVAKDPIAAKRALGYLPEGAPGYSDMTVCDFLTFVGHVRGLKGARLEARLAEMVERINLAETWNKPIETLSKGFKRRVGIAQALIHDPDVLVLDEPTDGLDPNQKHEMRSLIRDIAPNKAIVVSTHILEEVEAICSRAVIISAGKVVADRTPDALIAEAARPGAVEVTVTGTPEAAVRTGLASLSRDGAVDVVSVQGQMVRAIFTAAKADTSLADAAQAIADKGLNVINIAHHRPTLEAVFRAITNQQATS